MIVVLFLVAIVGLAWSQTAAVVKQKVITAKDTLKKTKLGLVPQEIQIDSTFIDPIQWKLYKKSVIASVVSVGRLPTRVSLASFLLFER
mgnify:CR=1 FL=1